MLHAMLTITTTATALWSNDSFAERVLQELSQEVSKQLALSVVTGDDLPKFILRATKTSALASEQANKAIVISCLRVHKHTQ